MKKLILLGTHSISQSPTQMTTCGCPGLTTLKTYCAFYNTRLSQSSFTKGPGLRPPQSKPRVTVERKTPSLTGRNLEKNQTSEGEPFCFWHWANFMVLVVVFVFKHYH